MFRPIFNLPPGVLRFLYLLGPAFEGFEIGAMAGDVTSRVAELDKAKTWLAT
jgi:hypothetical protein